MIVDLNGNPVSSVETIAPISKEYEKLIKVLKRRKQPFFMAVKHGNNLVIENTFGMESEELKKFLHYLIETKL